MTSDDPGRVGTTSRGKLIILYWVSRWLDGFEFAQIFQCVYIDVCIVTEGVCEFGSWGYFDAW